MVAKQCRFDPHPHHGPGESSWALGSGGSRHAHLHTLILGWVWEKLCSLQYFTISNFVLRVVIQLDREKQRWTVWWVRCGSGTYKFSQILLPRIHIHGYRYPWGRAGKHGPRKKKHGLRDAAPSSCYAFLENLFSLVSNHDALLFCLFRSPSLVPWMLLTSALNLLHQQNTVFFQRIYSILWFQILGTCDICL